MSHCLKAIFQPGLEVTSFMRGGGRWGEGVGGCYVLFFFLSTPQFLSLANCHLFASEDVRNQDYININIKLK